MNADLLTVRLVNFVRTAVLASVCLQLACRARVMDLVGLFR